MMLVGEVVDALLPQTATVALREVLLEFTEIFVVEAQRGYGVRSGLVRLDKELVWRNCSKKGRFCSVDY